MADQILKLLLGRSISLTWTTAAPNAMLGSNGFDLDRGMGLHHPARPASARCSIHAGAGSARRAHPTQSKGVPADEIALFDCSFLWLVYSFVDLHLAGIVGLKGLLYNLASLRSARQSWARVAHSLWLGSSICKCF